MGECVPGKQSDSRGRWTGGEPESGGPALILEFASSHSGRDMSILT